eukprot:scaffold76946_cov59-Phaeocystis_antarctica.AAC.4
MLFTVEANRVPRAGRRTIDRLVNRLSEPHKKPSAIGRAHMCAIANTGAHFPNWTSFPFGVERQSARPERSPSASRAPTNQPATSSQPATGSRGVESSQPRLLSRTAAAQRSPRETVTLKTEC